MVTSEPTVLPGICRFCHAFCGITVTVDQGKVVKVIGDVANPMTEGFSCVKGRALPDQHNNPNRILAPWVRNADGTLQQSTTDALIDDVAHRLSALAAEHGPSSLALYTGTYSFHYPTGAEMAKALWRALGSAMVFNTGTIDQPGKAIAKSLHGTWSAGPQPFDQADTWMIVGANPTVSMWGGIPQYNPAKRLRAARARGMRLIVIDPRRTEVAAVADVHLQVKPGEDPTLLAGMLRVILHADLIDHDFIRSDVSGVDELRLAVEPFTLDYVERRCGVSGHDVEHAATMFASGRVGSVTAGTGPNMAPRGTLTEYLVACLQTVCGRWLRAGDPVPNPYVLRPTRLSRAQADPKAPLVSPGPRLRVRGLGANPSGLPASALADEILTDGPGQIRALVSVGGNPLMAWPDQGLAQAALDKLDTLVQLDVRWSQTAQMATHVVGCKLGLETEAITLANERVWGYGAATTGYPVPYAQCAPPLVDPPAGSDVIEEWQFFYRIAQRLGLALEFSGVSLDMEIEPTTSHLHDLLCRGSRIPLSEVRTHPHGALFPDPGITVVSKEPGWTERLDVGHPQMMQELADVAGEPLRVAGDPFHYRLITRRLVNVYNSSGTDLTRLVGDQSYNAAYVNPADIESEGLVDGDVITIDAGHASILAVLTAAPDVRPGAISMAHGFGPGSGLTDGGPETALRTYGSPTNRLVTLRGAFDAVHGLPVMSAIPVNIRPAAST